MSAHLSTIHLLAGLAAELNEAEAKLYQASETLTGVKAQILHAISEASRPVDPAAPVDQGAPAPGKPPRPTEGRVAVTECAGGMQGSASEEGGKGSADLGAGACVALGSMVISPEADQALDGASLGEGVRNPDDPRPAPGSDEFEAVVERYGLYGMSVGTLSVYFGMDREDIVHVLRTARGIRHPGVTRGDVLRSGRGYPVE